MYSAGRATGQSGKGNLAGKRKLDGTEAQSLGVFVTWEAGVLITGYCGSFEQSL